MREGYTFGRWYKEPEGRTEWDFEKDTLPKFGNGGKLEGGTESNISGGHSSNKCGIFPDCTWKEFTFSVGSPCSHCQLYFSVKKSVVAIIALFYERKEYLAADLLNYNRTDTTMPVIDYWPKLGGRIAQAPKTAMV